MAPRRPSIPGQPKLAPRTTSLISSQLPAPTSLTNIRPLTGSTASEYGLRRPRHQIALRTGSPATANGLPGGMLPSGFSRSTLPNGVSSAWARAAMVFSPTLT